MLAILVVSGLIATAVLIAGILSLTPHKPPPHLYPKQYPLRPMPPPYRNPTRPPEEYL